VEPASSNPVSDAGQENTRIAVMGGNNTVQGCPDEPVLADPATACCWKQYL